ncbi:MAG: 1-acyl-sn-glycerol-3-phosphate acyltransferase [Clostridia bacterium]|jgi:1-acyl-sn-glycerol-3-phosphate acyltransferase|nr:1-acyl-sn-glycerol-3-phosphate acyltransferase [Clostridia bacterium]
MISSRTAKLIGYLPKGMLRYVSKKIVDMYLKKYANIKVLGKENIENINGPVIYICNHLSNSDGLVLEKVLRDKNVTFVAGMKLSNNPLTNLGMSIVKSISIKPNSADKDAISAIIKAVKAGESIFIFPEGTRSRTGKMIEGKKGVILISKVTKVPVIPVALWGTEKLMPVNKEGDMGAEKFYHADVHVSFGKPISVPKKDRDEDKYQYNDRVLEYFMKSIAKLLPEEYRGVYGEDN